MTDDEKESSIRDIKDVFYDNLDNWPTEAIKKNLFRLRPEEGAEVYLNLSEGCHDITNQGLELEKKFRPKLTIRTNDLKTELDRWNIGGGAFFRVIGDSPNINTTLKVCIQYFIIWTRQLFPFQFTFLSIPFFIATLFLWQFTKFKPPEPLPAYASIWTYVTFLITGLLFIGLGIWTYFEGWYKRFIKGYKSWKTVPDSMIGFVIPGLLFWTTALEYVITELASTNGGFIALIPISAWISLLLGIIILFIGVDFFLRGEKSLVEKFSHPMDYAPLLIFLDKDATSNWKIDGAQFDFFHYKTNFIPREKLIFEEDDDAKEHPSFLIDRSWHAFREYIKPNLMIRIFSNIFVSIFLWIITIGIYTIFLLAYFGINLGFINGILDHAAILTLIYIVLPMLATVMVWSRSRSREYKLDIWEDLAEKDDDELVRNHHMSYDKLRILWNLRNREHQGEQRITNLWSKSTWIEGDSSRLVARVKIQYPFERYKNWHTLRDTHEELLSLIAVQTKEDELRRLQEDIKEVKEDLQEQMMDGIDSIEEQLDEYFDDQKEELEEERAELKEKLEAIEDTIIEETEPEDIDTVEEIIEEIEEVTEEETEPTTEVFEESEIPDIPEVEEKKEVAPVEEETEDLGIPDVPTIDEIEEEPADEEEEFTIPDIPIDVEKEED